MKRSTNGPPRHSFNGHTRRALGTERGLCQHAVGKGEVDGVRGGNDGRGGGVKGEWELDNWAAPGHCALREVGLQTGGLVLLDSALI